MQKLHDMIVERVVSRLLDRFGYLPWTGRNSTHPDIERLAEDRLKALANWLANKAFKLYDGEAE
jgi:hypothetical protein